MPPSTIWITRSAGRDSGVVRHHQDGGALISGMPADQFDHLLRMGMIERSGRFVRQDQSRSIDERPRDRHALLLPGRKLTRQGMKIFRHADAGEKRQRPLLGLLAGRFFPRQLHGEP